MIVAIIILSLVSVCLGFVVWNLLKKVEKYEEDILLKDEFIDKIGKTVEDSYVKVKELDIRGAFESDDEVGFFFKNLKDISLTLSAYYQNYEDKEEPSKKAQ